jgi:hypothetical protein
MTTWFCDAYASWQKGGVENANGRLRRWLPRHIDNRRSSARESDRLAFGSVTGLADRRCASGIGRRIHHRTGEGKSALPLGSRKRPR